MVRNAVHNAFLNTLTMGTALPRVPLEMTHATCRFDRSQVGCIIRYRN